MQVINLSSTIEHDATVLQYNSGYYVLFLHICSTRSD